jgi:hypothetical protein
MHLNIEGPLKRERGRLARTAPKARSSLAKDFSRYALSAGGDARAPSRGVDSSMRTNLHQYEQMAFKHWIKKLGFWGFMFFLVKGLLWLTIPALLAFFATN